jgi:hypothetical protein
VAQHPHLLAEPVLHLLQHPVGLLEVARQLLDIAARPASSASRLRAR